jgi:hypothetical protein
MRAGSSGRSPESSGNRRGSSLWIGTCSLTAHPPFLARPVFGNRGARRGDPALEWPSVSVFPLPDRPASRTTRPGAASTPIPRGPIAEGDRYRVRRASRDSWGRRVRCREDIHPRRLNRRPPSIRKPEQPPRVCTVHPRPRSAPLRHLRCCFSDDLDRSNDGESKQAIGSRCRRPRPAMKSAIASAASIMCWMRVRSSSRILHLCRAHDLIAEVP